MAVSTPMGPATPGSRLERRCEGKRILKPSYYKRAGAGRILGRKSASTSRSFATGATGRGSRLHPMNSKRSGSMCATDYRLTGGKGAGWVAALRVFGAIAGPPFFYACAAPS